MSIVINWLNFLKSLYYGNKKLLVISLLIIVALVIVGCSTGQGSPPPSGPIGGGCG